MSMILISLRKQMWHGGQKGTKLPRPPVRLLVPRVCSSIRSRTTHVGYRPRVCKASPKRKRTRSRHPLIGWLRSLGQLRRHPAHQCPSPVLSTEHGPVSPLPNNTVGSSLVPAQIRLPPLQPRRYGGFGRHDPLLSHHHSLRACTSACGARCRGPKAAPQEGSKDIE